MDLWPTGAIVVSQGEILMNVMLVISNNIIQLSIILQNTHEVIFNEFMMWYDLKWPNSELIKAIDYIVHFQLKAV